MFYESFQTPFKEFAIKLFLLFHLPWRNFPKSPMLAWLMWHMLYSPMWFHTTILLGISKTKLVDFSFSIFLDSLFELMLILLHFRLRYNLSQPSPIFLMNQEELSFGCTIFYNFLLWIEEQNKEELSCSFDRTSSNTKFNGSIY